MKTAEKHVIEMKQNRCVCNSAILIEQINSFLNPYAFHYPKYQNINDCKECPYQLVKTKSSKMNDEQKNALIKLYDDYHITPQNTIGEEITKDEKLKLIKEYLDENRTIFHREEERIIYTEAFRRLQYKTQVMVNSASDDQRTRLLHSLEVQKIARKIAIALKANYELAETIAIAHDIGHAPFGHAGENAIKIFLENNLAGSFSHALQSVKVIDFLCSHRALKPLGIKGLGISDLVLEGILKHDSDSFTDNLSSAKYRLQYDCPRLYKPVGVKEDKFYQDGNIYIGGIESQIVCWADKIAYLGHDWEEFVAVDLLEVMLSRINSIIIQLDDFSKFSKERKYNYLTKEEKGKLYELHFKFNEMKDALSSEDYTDEIIEYTDTFIQCLDDFIDACEKTVSASKVEPEKYLLFSYEQYKTLYAFFKVARCWMIITKKKPEKIGGKMDIVFIMYKYLNDTTSHRTVPALIQGLINSCKEELMFVNCNTLDRCSLIKTCNEKWQNKKSCNSLLNPKTELRNSFAVYFDKNYTDAIDYINKFIFQELINSTRVRYMTKKAEIIVNKLMEFYYNNYEMLPLKYRKRIDFECSNKRNIDKINALLIEYYKNIIEYAYKADKMCKTESISNVVCAINNIYNKVYYLTKNDDCVNKNANSHTFSKDIERVVKENIVIAKDTIKLRVIADYVSGMTDRMAEMKYNEICSSSTQWSKAYSERGTFNLS